MVNKVKYHKSTIDLFTLFLQNPKKGERPIELAHAFLSKKTEEEIYNYLFRKVKDYCEETLKKPFNPRAIMSDCDFAELNAASRALNNEPLIDNVIGLNNIVKNKATKDDLEKTRILLCNVHFLRNLKFQISKTSVINKGRLLTFFSALAAQAYLADYETVLKHLFTILLAKK